MKKFLFKISLFVVILIAFITTLLMYVPVQKQSYMYEYYTKCERLDTLTGNRLILVGGSNLAFSIDSEMISDSLNLNVINMGLHAGIGLRYMIDSMTKYLNHGDIIIIMPEYEHFFNLYNGQFETIAPAFLNTPNKDIGNLNLEQISNVIAGIPSHIKSNILFRKTEKWQYSSDNFNEYGDEIAHRNEQSKKFWKPATLTSSINTNAIEDLIGKISNLKNSGCEVYLFWPITIESNYLANQQAIKSISNNFKQRNIQFSVSPDYFVQPDSMAFDTYYHLNGIAAIESAKRFIKVVKEKRIVDNQE